MFLNLLAEVLAIVGAGTGVSAAKFHIGAEPEPPKRKVTILFIYLPLCALSVGDLV